MCNEQWDYGLKTGTSYGLCCFSIKQVKENPEEYESYNLYDFHAEFF